MIVWLDDMRNPKYFGVDNAVWCKNYAAFESIVYDNSTRIVEIHFDNDLGEVMEGYDAFVLIESMLFLNKMPSLSRLFVHTSNPSASSKFMSAKDLIFDRFGVTMVRKNY